MKKPNPTPAKVIVKPKDGDEPKPVEVIEAAIVEIAAGMRKLNQTRLRRDTIILLLHDVTKLGKKDISYVLNAMDVLEQTYLKPIIR